MELEMYWNPGAWAIFLLFLVFSTACYAIIRMIFPTVIEEDEIVRAVTLATQISSHSQRIRKIKNYPPPGMLIMSLRANSSEMEEVELCFPESHPDRKELETLQSLNEISFMLQTEAIRKVNKFDTVAYLRLKK